MITSHKRQFRNYKRNLYHPVTKEKRSWDFSNKKHLWEQDKGKPRIFAAEGGGGRSIVEYKHAERGEKNKA